MNLAAEKRDARKPAALRNEGRIPAIVYNHEVNIPVSVDLREFDRVFRLAGGGTLIDLDVNGETHPVLVRAVQMNKRKRVPQHVDFYAVTATEQVEVAVGIEFEGIPIGVRDSAGQLDVQRREVLINVLPRLIPGDLVLDITSLEIGDSLHISDLVALLPKEAEIIDDLELAVISVVPPRLAEEETPSEEEESIEPEVIGESDEEDEEE